MDEDTYRDQFSIQVASGEEFWSLVGAAQEIVDRHAGVLGVTPTPDPHVSVSFTNARYERPSLASTFEALDADQKRTVPIAFRCRWSIPRLTIILTDGFSDGLTSPLTRTLKVAAESPDQLLATQNRASLEAQFGFVAKELERLRPSSTPATAASGPTPDTATLTHRFKLPDWTNNALVASLVAGLVPTAIAAGLGWWGNLGPTISARLLATALLLAVAVAAILLNVLVASRFERPTDRSSWWSLIKRQTVRWLAFCGLAAACFALWLIWTQLAVPPQ